MRRVCIYSAENGFTKSIKCDTLLHIKYKGVKACLKNVPALVIIQTHREREYICVPHYRESPRICIVEFPQAERGVYGADGRWLWRGVAEEM